MEGVISEGMNSGGKIFQMVAFTIIFVFLSYSGGDNVLQMG